MFPGTLITALLLLLPTQEESFLVHLIEGSALKASTVKFLADGKVELGPTAETATNDPPLRSAGEILAVEVIAAKTKPSRQTAFFLPGGEIWFGQITASGEDAIEIENELYGAASLPLTAIEGIAVGQRGRNVDELEELGAKLRLLPRDADAILLSNGDVISGAIASFGPGPWKIERDGNSQEVDPSLLAGAALDKNLLDYKTPTGPHLLVQLTDGSQLVAKSIETKVDRLEVVTHLGPTLSLPLAGEQRSGVARVEYRGGRVVYLSDLPPAAIEHLPFLDDRAPPRMDKNVLGAPLHAQGKRHAKGIGVRSGTRLDFDVVGYERFLAQVAVDDAAGPMASFDVAVLLDGKQVFQSGEMTSGAEPRLIDVPLNGAKTLSLVTSFARRGDLEDYADWIAARLIKSP